MPRLSLPDSIANTEAQIETLVNEIEFLMSGVLDTDNLFRDGNISARIPSKKIIDLADNTRPIEGNKFFGYNAADNLKFRDTVFDPLINLMAENKVFIPIEIKEPFLINNKPEIVSKKEKNVWGSLKSIGSGIGTIAKNAISVFGDDKEKKKTKLEIDQEEFSKIQSEQENVYNRELIARKPPNFKLVRTEDLIRLFPEFENRYDLGFGEFAFAPSIDVRSNLTDSDSATIDIELANDGFDETTFNVRVLTSALSDTQYINIDVSIIALFEVIP